MLERLKPGLGVAVVAAVLAFGIRARESTRFSSRVLERRPGDLSFRLTESSADAGLIHLPGKFVPHPSLANIAPRLGSMGVSVAVVDYDGDGWPDVFATDPARGGRSRLFRNNRDGTFTDVAEKAGLARAGGGRGAWRALFFDSRNRGREDLLLTTSSCTVFFANQGGGIFRDETARSGLRHCGVSYATNVIDYDGDGFLDVVIADYFKPVDFSDPKSFDFMPNSATSADNGGPILVYHNNGDGTFTPAKDNLGIKSRGWTLSVGVYDLRGTGRPDLYFATDFNSDQLYLNEGGGRFSNASRLVVDKFSRNGMTAEAADVDNDGRPAVFVGNIYEPPYALGGNLLWKRGADGRWSDAASALGVGECGWAMGAKFLDLDNDGRQDLVVTNGYISADRTREYWYESGLMSASLGPVMSDVRNWPPMGRASLAGYETKCVYMNTGAGFTDVTARTGLAEDRSDGRGLAAIDAGNDGRLGLVEINEGQPLRYYRNAQDNGGAWIGFKLVGTRSNRDAFGATVAVRLKDKTLTREVEPGNGYMAQSDARLHFGLGKDPKIEEISVRWPSGLRQALPKLEPGRYHTITEPKAGGSAR